MASADPTYAIVAAILGVVPASHWTFARIEPHGELTSYFGSVANGTQLARLADELMRQRQRVPSGARIAATLGSLDEYASGITLLFADARSNFGILTMLRSAAQGPFTSSEISMLTFALDAVSEQLSALRLQPAAEHFHSGMCNDEALQASSADEAFYVLNSDFEIVLAWKPDEERRVALTGFHTHLHERLPIVLEETVRELTAAWSNGSVKRTGIARPVPFLVVRTQPMSGPGGLFIGVRIDRFRPSNSLTGAALEYRISPREVQVLALLLDGYHLEEIASQLHITSSTVQDHIRSMVAKTDSRNRTELIAKVLGWEVRPPFSKD